MTETEIRARLKLLAAERPALEERLERARTAVAEVETGIEALDHARWRSGDTPPRGGEVRALLAQLAGARERQRAAAEALEDNRRRAAMLRKMAVAGPGEAQGKPAEAGRQ